MRKKTVFILFSVVAGAALAAGLGVLIWWLVTRNTDYTTVRLEGEGIGTLPYTAAFTRIKNAGDMFWWFYPTVSSEPETRPIILWLDGATGTPPSLLANLGMFGPYDINLNRRTDSWVDRFNLLFIDAPLGTGFSTLDNSNQIPTTIDENVDYLMFTLNSFYEEQSDYSEAPLYIFGQAHGAQLALALAIRLSQTTAFSHNLKGVALGNGIVSPALTMTKLGFYLEELGYIDANGRYAIDSLATETYDLVNQENYNEAFDAFLSLGDFVNENGAVAVNLGHIVEKITRQTNRRDYFGQRQYFQDVFRNTDFEFMNNVVAPALGVPSDVTFDANRDAVLTALRDTFMVPAVDKVEYILQNTELTVSIYNGNLDAVSNTPGQLEWVNNLQWSGQAEFRNSPRETLVINRLVEGYFRETDRLRFYWMNAAGQSVPLDSPVAMNTTLHRIVS